MSGTSIIAQMFTSLTLQHKICTINYQNVVTEWQTV